jgi:hypothetical protein
MLSGTNVAETSTYHSIRECEHNDTQATANWYGSPDANKGGWGYLDFDDDRFVADVDWWLIQTTSWFTFQLSAVSGVRAVLHYGTTEQTVVGNSGETTIETIGDCYVEICGMPEEQYRFDTALLPLPQPDLEPVQPTGWSSPIVVTTAPGRYTDDSPLGSNQSLCVSWAGQNAGNLATTAAPSNLYLDGVLIASRGESTALARGATLEEKDLPLGRLSAGQRTLKVVFDENGVVDESDETNNSYTKTINVTAVADLRVRLAAVPEDMPAGAVAGALTTEYLGTGPYTYSLVAGEGSEDNASFTFDGDLIRTAQTFHYDAGDAYNVRVRTTSADGQWLEKALTIDVVDAAHTFSTGGRLWFDVNGDGVQSDGEPGVAGVTVDAVYCPTSSSADGVRVQSATTDAEGQYRFENLLAGYNYRVAVLAPQGSSFTRTNAGNDDALDSDVDAAGATSIFTGAGGSDAGVFDAGLVGVPTLWHSVGGTLTGVVDWTDTTVPYVLSDDTTVAVGAKLTIGAGVRVIGNSHTLTVAGSLTAAEAQFFATRVSLADASIGTLRGNRFRYSSSLVAAGTSLAASDNMWDATPALAASPDNVVAMVDGNRYAAARPETITVLGGRLTRSAEWPSLAGSTTQYELSTDITVGSGCTLTLDVGAMLSSDGGRLVVDGALNASAITLSVRELHYNAGGAGTVSNSTLALSSLWLGSDQCTLVDNTITLPTQTSLSVVAQAAETLGGNTLNMPAGSVILVSGAMAGTDAVLPAVGSISTYVFGRTQSDYEFAGIYSFHNLTLGDRVEVLSSGISQLVLKVTGTLTMGANATIRVRNGYYAEVPSRLPSAITTTADVEAQGVLYNGVRLFPETYGRGGNGGRGGDGRKGVGYADCRYVSLYGRDMWAVWGGVGGGGGGGGAGGFGGGIGGSGGQGGIGVMGQEHDPTGIHDTCYMTYPVNGPAGYAGGNSGTDGGRTPDLNAGGVGGRATGVGKPGEGIVTRASGAGGSGGGGNGGAGGCFEAPSVYNLSSTGSPGGGGGGGGYGGGVLSIYAGAITYNADLTPQFLVSGQVGGAGGGNGATTGENGGGGLLIIECPHYTSSTTHWNLSSSSKPASSGDVNGGHGTLLGNPGSVVLGTTLPVWPAHVSVLGHGTEITNGDTTPSAADDTSFGDIQQGQTGPTRVFTVVNDGNQTLTLKNLAVPAGFSVVEGLSSSLAPGEADTISIRLNTRIVGTFSGNVSFKTNDTTNSVFCFQITGEVLESSEPPSPEPVTVGVFNPTSSCFHLRCSNTSGSADYTFGFGQPNGGWTVLTGDWDGDGTTGVGLYDSYSSTFYLTNAHQSGFAEYTFGYGAAGAGWEPLVGDWNGDGKAGVGLYDPKNSTFYLTDTLEAGYAGYTFGYGVPDNGWIPIVGDWNGKGSSGVGLYDPHGSCFYLTESLQTGYAQYTFGYGVPNGGWKPIVGDWNGDAATGVGLYDPLGSAFYLTDTLATGYAEITFSYGVPGGGWKPLVGDWDGDGKAGVGLYDTSGETFYLSNALSTGVAESMVQIAEATTSCVPLVGCWSQPTAVSAVAVDAINIADVAAAELESQPDSSLNRSESLVGAATVMDNAVDVALARLQE